MKECLSINDCKTGFTVTVHDHPPTRCCCPPGTTGRGQVRGALGAAGSNELGKK